MKTTISVAERVRTLDPSRPLARALAVRGDTVLAVGTREEVLAAAGPGAQWARRGPRSPKGGGGAWCREWTRTSWRSRWSTRRRRWWTRGR
ncbi:MAG TPA: hypothetical protein VK539_18310 [Myxococcaceae bacterium]|nr:hypothetical protein [Myxococcaceae bacterium]